MAVGAQIKVLVGFLHLVMFECSDSSEECIALVSERKFYTLFPLASL